MTIARRGSNLLFAVGQAVVPALGYAGLFGETARSQIQTIKTPVVPADYAFLIWPVIFILSLLYAIDQARPKRSQEPAYQRIGGFTAAAFAANTAWSIVAQLDGPLALTGVIFMVAAAASLCAAWRVSVPDAPFIGRLAIGALAGWITVAIFANWSVILADLGLAEVGGAQAQAQALALLSGAGLVAAAVIWRTRGSLSYSLAVGWALIGVIVGNLDRGTSAVALGAGLYCAILAACVLAAKRRGKPALKSAGPDPMARR